MAVARKRTWLGAAEQVLSESELPMTAAEIARKAYELGLMPERGDAPEYSVQSAIGRDLKTGRRKDSPFVYFDDGKKQLKYGLRKHLNGA